MDKSMPPIICALFSLSILSPFFTSCSKEPSGGTSPPPEKTRQEIPWLDSAIQLTPGNHWSSSEFFQYGDTLDMDIQLIVPNEVGYIFIADAQNYHCWENNEAYTTIFSQENSTGGNFLVRIPAEDTCYVAIHNNQGSNTIRVRAITTIIRWVYE